MLGLQKEENEKKKRRKWTQYNLGLRNDAKQHYILRRLLSTQRQGITRQEEIVT